MAIVSSYCKMDCYLKALQIKLFVQKFIHINNGTQNNIIKTLELKNELKTNAYIDAPEFAWPCHHIRRNYKKNLPCASGSLGNYWHV